MVREMAQGQKLESVGRIAAGVAHEINTSVQFISDSVRFVRHALKDVPRALADYRVLAADALSGKDVAAQARRASDTDEAADVDYFLKNAPDALDRALEGIGRVGSIVRSMTEFAHPDSRVKADVDINRAIKTTLNMARNEYKDRRRSRNRFRRHPVGALPRRRHQPGVPQPAAQCGARDWRRGRKHRPQGPDHRAHARPRRLCRDLDRRHRRRHSRVGARAGFSSRSSRPRKSGAAPARASRCRAASWSRNSRVHFISKRKRGKGRFSSSDCPCRISAYRPIQLTSRLQHDFSSRVICR